jgi:CspA family cold shock protein
MGRATQTATLAGTVKSVHSGKGFGFIEGPDGQQYFFHRSAVIGGGRFDEILAGDRVTFAPGEGEKGPRAERVSVG